MMSWLQRFRELQVSGIVGLNERNACFIQGYNPRQLYPLVDNKVKTKELAEKAGIQIAPTYAIIEMNQQASCMPDLVRKHQRCAVKPASGCAGNGVLIIDGLTELGYRQANGNLLSLDELEFHIANILSGMFSLGGRPDKAIVEYRIDPDSFFGSLGGIGVPDIRIILFLGVPAMAMLRLPTPGSDGKANLHCGAIGLGIDLTTGCTIKAMWKDRFITQNPFFDTPLLGQKVPNWDQLLLMAAQCYEFTGLGYMGIDIVVDRHLGPLLIELNARPGLSIQIANQEGLRPRLLQIQKKISTLSTTEAKVRYARQYLGSKG